MTARSVRGIVVPMVEIVVREIVVAGRAWPVVWRYEPLGPLWAHRQWGRFAR